MISACGVDRDTSWLVNYEEIVILVDNANGLAADGWFMAMSGVRKDLAIFEYGIAPCRFTIDTDRAGV